jgi:hypothetical protein
MKSSKQTNDKTVQQVDDSKPTPAQILATDGPRRVTAPAPPNEHAANEARAILSRE